MSILTYGLNSVEQGECPWRITINNNITNSYTKTESDNILSGKSSKYHPHASYFPLPNLVESSDIAPVVNGLSNDLVFTAHYGPCLVDRTTFELVRVVIDSGTISLVGTGIYH